MDEISELVTFLASERLELRAGALQGVLSITGNEDHLLLLCRVPKVFSLLTAIATRDKQEPLKKDAILSLINLSANKTAASAMLESDSSSEIITGLWGCVSSLAPTTADPACMTLCNLSVEKVGSDRVFDALKISGISMSDVVDVLCKDTTIVQTESKNDEENKEKKPTPNLNYMGPFVSNLSQLPEVREELMSDSAKLFSRLLPFTEYSRSAVRRGGAIGAIRNCCFDTNVHMMLLKEMDLLPRLLLPLAGPTPESLDDVEVEKLPIDLQYLDESKSVEEDPDIRRLLLEALCQLCATKECREIIREQNAYVILRELHKTEKEGTVKLACENVVDILIKKEEEIKLDNYKEVDVPEDIQEKLNLGDENV